MNNYELLINSQNRIILAVLYVTKFNAVLSVFLHF